MRAKFKGTNSMGYKNSKIYILATTFNGGYLWAVDINGKGKPVPYSNAKTFLKNWDVLDIPKDSSESQIELEIIKESKKGMNNL